MSENRLPQWDLSPIFGSPEGEDFKAALRSVDTLCQSIRDSLAAGEALAAVLPGCTAAVSAEIRLGGLIVVSADGRTRLDLSLDAALEEQKQWFFSNSRLDITL